MIPELFQVDSEHYKYAFKMMYLMRLATLSTFFSLGLASKIKTVGVISMSEFMTFRYRFANPFISYLIFTTFVLLTLTDSNYSLLTILSVVFYSYTLNSIWFIFRFKEEIYWFRSLK